MKQILFCTAIFIVLVTTACGNRNNTDGRMDGDSIPMTPYDTPIDTLGRDSIDSIIPPTPAPIMPMK